MANPSGAPPPDPETAPPALAVPLLLPKDGLKIALKGKRKATLELKPDGGLTNGGKPAATLGRDGAIQDAKGQPVLTVKGDAVLSLGGATLATFSGDSELTTLKGEKLAIGDDGSITLNETAVGKVEAVGNSKRAALVGVWYVLFPPPEKLKETEPRPKPAGKPTPKGRGKKR